jgi:hypothetical protein
MVLSSSVDLHHLTLSLLMAEWSLPPPDSIGRVDRDSLWFKPKQRVVVVLFVPVAVPVVDGVVDPDPSSSRNSDPDPLRLIQLLISMTFSASKVSL